MGRIYTEEELRKLKTEVLLQQLERELIDTALVELEARRLTAQVAVSATLRADELKTRLQQLEQMLQGERRVSEQLRQHNERLDSVGAKLEQQLAAAERSITGLQKQLEDKCAELKGWIKAHNSLSADHEALKNTLHKERQSPRAPRDLQSAMTVERINNHSERLNELEEVSNQLVSKHNNLCQRLHQLEEAQPQPNLPKGVHVQQIDVVTGPNGTTTEVTFSGELTPEITRKLWRGWD